MLLLGMEGSSPLGSWIPGRRAAQSCHQTVEAYSGFVSVDPSFSSPTQATACYCGWGYGR